MPFDKSSRFSLLAGMHAFGHKVRILPPNARLIVPTEEPTFVTVLAAAGSATGVVRD